MFTYAHLLKISIFCWFLKVVEMFIIILKDISVFLLNNKLKREYKIMLIKIRGGNMKRDFFEKWSFILNLILFCAFLFLVVLMFYKDVDLIYIFCTLLISLLPLLNIIKRIGWEINQSSMIYEVILAVID